MNDYLKYIPLLSGLLIFIGFLNYHTYYSYFDIDISSYLTTGELILSFLPLSVPLLFLAGYYIFFILGIAWVMKIEGKGGQWDPTNYGVIWVSLHEIVSDIHSIRDRLRPKNRTRSGLVFALIQIPLIVYKIAHLFILYLYIFVLFFTIMSWINFPAYALAFWSIIWLVWIQGLLEQYKSVIDDKRILMKVFPLAVFILVMVVFNKEKAFKALNGNLQDVEIYYKDQVYRSNMDTLFIGKTKEFVFLRVKSANENLVLPLKGVNKIAMDVN